MLRDGNEILTTLQTIRAKDSSQKQYNFWQAVKGIWNEEKLQDLEKRLESIRGEILMHLVSTMR